MMSTGSIGQRATYTLRRSVLQPSPEFSLRHPRQRPAQRRLLTKALNDAYSISLTQARFTAC